MLYIFIYTNHAGYIPPIKSKANKTRSVGSAAKFKIPKKPSTSEVKVRRKKYKKRNKGGDMNDDDGNNDDDDDDPFSASLGVKKSEIGRRKSMRESRGRVNMGAIYASDGYGSEDMEDVMIDQYKKAEKQSREAGVYVSFLSSFILYPLVLHFCSVECIYDCICNCIHYSLTYLL